MSDIEVMHLALREANRGLQKGEVPVGAVAVLEGKVIAAAHNAPRNLCDPTAHAEILVLREAASAVGAYRIEGLELFVTLEPCLMCFGAMIHARIARLVYGAADPKVGFSRIFEQHLQEAHFNHRIEILDGVLQDECAALLKSFFRLRR